MELPANTYIVRHVPVRDISSTNEVSGATFRLKGRQRGISVYHLEHWPELPKDQQLAMIYHTRGRNFNNNDGLAIIRVGDLKAALDIPTRVIKRAVGENVSHSDILGLANHRDEDEIFKQIADCVLEIHLVKDVKQRTRTLPAAAVQLVVSGEFPS